MSAADRTVAAAADPGAHVVRLASCAADIVEIAALPGRARALGERASARGVTLAAAGQLTHQAECLVVSVRPERWQLLYPPAPPGSLAERWQAACKSLGAAVELSSALTALHLSGPAAREVLARGCRLDLDPQLFRPGRAAATLIAQVAVTLAALPSGLLLLTPSSTARHIREWLASAAQPFGLMPFADVTVAMLSGEKST